MNIKRFKRIILWGMTVFLASCQSVKPYQKIYLNDHEMTVGNGGVRVFEESVYVYREGATGGGGGKPSGGCGCN